jgi:hypothetical protein
MKGKRRIADSGMAGGGINVAVENYRDGPGA